VIELRPDHIVMIVGVRGQGKTELMKWLIRKFAERGHRILIYDCEYEHEFEEENIEVYKPSDATNVEEFDRICKRVWNRGRMIFAIESIDFFTAPKKPLSPYFKLLVHWGRRKKIGLIMTTRRIADVHKSPCSQAHHWFCFYTFLPNDVKYMKEFIGDSALRCAELKDYEFLYWSRGKVIIYPPIDIR